jgi:hypothetical protein
MAYRTSSAVGQLVNLEISLVERTTYAPHLSPRSQIMRRCQFMPHQSIVIKSVSHPRKYPCYQADVPSPTGLDDCASPVIVR